MYIDHKDAEFLISLIQRMVKHLKEGNEHLYNLLKKVTQKRRCIIQVDHVKLYLESRGIKRYQLEIGVASPDDKAVFVASGDAIRQIIDGTFTLDYAMMKGYIEVYGDIEDLINIHNLFIGILSEGPVFPQLRDLWDEFDSNWTTSITKKTIPDLDHQNIFEYNTYKNTDPMVSNVKIKI